MRLRVAIAMAALLVPRLGLAQREVGFTVAAGGGVAASGDLGAAPRGMIAFGLWNRMGAGAFEMAARASYESYGTSGVGSQPCVAGRPNGACVTNGMFAYSTFDEAVVLEFAVTYRFVDVDHRWIPYVGVAPGVVWERAQSLSGVGAGTMLTDTQTRGSMRAIVGVEWRLGPGGAFAELSGRWASFDTPGIPGAMLGPVLADLGYRLEL